MTLVGVEMHLAVRECADRLAVLADVRDEHHGGMLDAEGAAGGDWCRRAEHLGKAHLRVLIERLVAQQDHQILMPGVEKRLLERVVDRIAQVDTQDLGAERRRKRPHHEGRGRCCLRCRRDRSHVVPPSGLAPIRPLQRKLYRGSASGSKPRQLEAATRSWVTECFFRSGNASSPGVRPRYCLPQRTARNLIHSPGDRRYRWQPPHRSPPTRTNPPWPRDLRSPARAAGTPPPGPADSRSIP